MPSSGGRLCWAYDIIRQREHLDTGAHGPLHSMGRCSGHSGRVGPNSGSGPGPKCILLLRVAGEDTYKQGRPIPVPVYGRPFPDRKVNQSRTTPYHLLGNGFVERNDRMLGDALRSLLLSRDQEEWDRVLPQIMRAYRSTPYSCTQETPNFLMLG